MKAIFVNILLSGLLLFNLTGHSQELSEGQAKKEYLKELVAMATGTGKTTGHVANLVLQNNSEEALSISIGPFLIPGLGKHQGYLIPDAIDIEIAPGQSSVAKLIGYCTNINLPPAPLDEALSPFALWSIPDGSYSTEQEDWQIPEGYYLNVSQELGDFPYKLTYPGTDKTFIYSVEFDKHPETAADLLLLCHDLIEEQYLFMERINTIRTPYSNNLERQKSALIQHTFWIYTSSLLGDAYVKEEFKSKMSEQFLELVSDQNTPILQRQFDEGVDDFWSSFLKLAQAAKIFKVAE